MVWLTLVTRLTVLCVGRKPTQAKMVERHFNLFNNGSVRGAFSIT